MTLKAVLSSQPEANAEFYEERDGLWFLRVEPATVTVDGKTQNWSLEDTGGLRSKLSDREERHTSAQSRIKELETKLEEAQSSVEKLRDAKPDEKVQARHKAELEQLNERHKKELAKRDERENVLISEVRRYGLDAAVDHALAEKAKDAKAIGLLRPHVMSLLEMRESDGKFEVVVKGADGNPRLSQKQGSTDRMSVGELVSEMAEDDTFAVAFKGSGSAGSGASGAGSSGSEPSGTDLNKLPPLERLKRLRQGAN